MMKIVNKTKFIRTISILIILISSLILFAKNTYSKNEIIYKENYIYSGDTLWSIAKSEIKNNTYFKNKDIREVVNELEKINNLNNTILIEGEKIKIPIYK